MKDAFLSDIIIIIIIIYIYNTPILGVVKININNIDSD